MEASKRLESIVRDVINDNIFEGDDNVQDVEMPDFEDFDGESEPQARPLDKTSTTGDTPSSMTAWRYRPL